MLRLLDRHPNSLLLNPLRYRQNATTLPRADWTTTSPRRRNHRMPPSVPSSRTASEAFSSPPRERRDNLLELLRNRDRYAGIGRRDTVGSLERLFGLYMTHHRVEGMPADTNFTEKVIKQLSKKIRLIEGFATMASAETFSRLLVGRYRFKRFTDSCQRNGSGRSPLELAGVNPVPNDWLRYLIRPVPKQPEL